MDVAVVADELDARLRARAVPDRAEHEKAYLKSDLQHYGTSVPAIRAAAKEVVAAHPELDREQLLAVVEALWAVPVHERRMAAVELLDLCSDRLLPADAALLERLLRECRTWALVDGLAASVTGALVEHHPQVAEVLDRWVTDEDFWVRRAALLALLLPLRRGEGDVARLFRYADALLEDPEPFLRKAVGWVLRDTARKRPDLVHDWLLPRAGRASTVTVREAVKPLSEEQRRAVLAARERAVPRPGTR